jgi:hypothetical protein
LRCPALARSILKRVKISFTLDTLEHFRHSKGDFAIILLCRQLKAGSCGPGFFTKPQYIQLNTLSDFGRSDHFLEKEKRSGVLP